MKFFPAALAAVAVISTAGAALADDPMTPGETDFYAGIFAGGGSGWADDHFPDVPDADIDRPVSGWLGGVFAGVDTKLDNNLVFGLEADVALSGIETGPIPSFGSLDTKMNWMSSLRARLGYTINNTTLYVTGGGALASVTVDNIVAGISIYGAETNSVFGYTLGAGVQHEFGDGWFGRGEYRYSSFQPSSYGNGNFGAGTAVELSVHTATAGIGKKF